MIYENDSIGYMNVYSKRYICHYKKLGVCMKEFMETLKHAGIKRNGELFYTINNISKDAMLEIELFQAANGYYAVQDEKIRFHSYYYLSGMLSSVVLDDFDNIEWKYAEIMQYMEQKDKKAQSNFYNEVHSNGAKKYLIIKVAGESM